MDSVILRDLRKAYEAGGLIVFVGAGISAAARLPTWKGLAEALRDRARGYGAGSEALEEMEELIKKDQLLEAVSAAKHALRGEFEREVRAALDDAGRTVPEAARAIAALRPRLWAVITTNLDRLLERAFEGDWPEMTSPPGDLAQERHYILKMHGTLRDARTWIFTQEQYDRAMFASPQLQATFEALYRTHPMLFVGFGLADDNIDLTLGKVRALSAGQPPAHFALLPRAVLRPSRRRTLEATGIRLLEYANAHGDHREVTEVLRWLAGPPDAPLSTSSSTTAAVAAAAAAAPAAPAAPAGAPAETEGGPLSVFICYAPGDAELRKRLEIHLSPLAKRDKLVSAWHAGLIAAGEEMEEAVRARLAKARLILLLISAELLDSEENDAQVAFAMEQHRSRASRVVPILLRPCNWETSRFKDLQVLPRNRTPVTKWGDREDAFAEIAKELRDVVRSLRSGPPG
jgi:hypothetical protein